MFWNLIVFALISRYRCGEGAGGERRRGRGDSGGVGSSRRKDPEGEFWRRVGGAWSWLDRRRRRSAA